VSNGDFALPVAADIRYFEQDRINYIVCELEMKKYCLESRSRRISYMKYVNGTRTGLVTFCVEPALYNGLLKEKYKGDRSDKKTRKKT
jgi:hypothetical protein